jgi:hypothetical protein
LINVCLVIFLSLKNTPLAILSTSSYDKLMPLHKVSGYTAIVAAWIHAIVYLEAWAQTANLHGILEVDNIAGVMGGIALLLIGVSTLSYVRERLYEGIGQHPEFHRMTLTVHCSILYRSYHPVDLYHHRRRSPSAPCWSTCIDRYLCHGVDGFLG